MQSSLNSDELDKMKADAIRRAKQMRSRASIPLSMAQKQDTPSDQAQIIENKSSGGLSSFTKILGMDSDQLVLIALALLLKGNKQNIPIIIALLYIAM